MTGYMKIEKCTRDGREGISCETHLENVDNVDKFQILNSVCDSLHMQPQEVMMFATLKSYDAFEKPEVIYNHSISTDFVGMLEQLLQEEGIE